jgi:hypothetical protein
MRGIHSSIALRLAHHLPAFFFFCFCLSIVSVLNSCGHEIVFFRPI